MVWHILIRTAIEKNSENTKYCWGCILDFSYTNDRNIKIQLLGRRVWNFFKVKHTLNMTLQSYRLDTKTFTKFFGGRGKKFFLAALYLQSRNNPNVLQGVNNSTNHSYYGLLLCSGKEHTANMMSLGKL